MTSWHHSEELLIWPLLVVLCTQDSVLVSRKEQNANAIDGSVEYKANFKGTLKMPYNIAHMHSASSAGLLDHWQTDLSAFVE